MNQKSQLALAYSEGIQYCKDRSFNRKHFISKELTKTRKSVRGWVGRSKFHWKLLENETLKLVFIIGITHKLAQQIFTYIFMAFLHFTKVKFIKFSVKPT